MTLNHIQVRIPYTDLTFDSVAEIRDTAVATSNTRRQRRTRNRSLIPGRGKTFFSPSVTRPALRPCLGNVKACSWPVNPS